MYRKVTMSTRRRGKPHMRPIVTATAPDGSAFRKSKSYEQVIASMLSIDPGLQREVKPALLAMLTPFNREFAGCLEVSRRADGSMVILEGQHRWLAAKKEDPDMLLDCLVHEGLTREEEATIFLKFNVARMAVSHLHIYRVSLESGDPIALSVQRQLDAHGLKMAKSASTNLVGAVVPCIATVRMDKDENDLLEVVLTVMEDAWGRSKTTWDGLFIRAIAEVINRNLDDVDLDRLTHVLAGKAIERWKQELFKAADSSFGSESRAFALGKVIVKAYNLRLRSTTRISW